MGLRIPYHLLERGRGFLSSLNSSHTTNSGGTTNKRVFNICLTTLKCSWEQTDLFQSYRFENCNYYFIFEEGS